MRAEEIKGLMEAYSQVHGTPEVLNEEVVEEDTEVLDEQGGRGSSTASQTNQSVRIPGGRTATRVVSDLGTSLAASTKVPTSSGPRNVRGGGQIQTTSRPTPTPAAPVKPASAPTASPKPSATPAAPVKPASAPTASPKPSATPATKPAGSAMDQWAAANPKLAAAKAERDRTRGTSATTNPLMKDMKANLPAPKSPAPSTAKTGFDLAKKGVNLAAGVDLFDLVKGHLLDEGYADTEEGAMVIMVNMSEEWRKSILESHGVDVLNEISQKTATSAYAQRRTGEFEGDDASDRVAKTNKLKGRIEKKFGAKAGEHADRAADVKTFGRKDASGRRKQSPQPRIQTSDHENQREFKRELRIKRDRRLRKEDLEAWVDELIAEGYDLSEYTWEEVAEIYAQELELEEGMSMKDFKANRKKNERKEASADAEKRGHVDKFTGKTYGTAEASSRRKDIHNPEKKPSRDAARDAAGGETGHGGPLRTNKVRKAKAMGEISEAQRARENPEDHDKEEKRKYEPVRGERTPMPPRGDKRREDFEKWYAKHVR